MTVYCKDIFGDGQCRIESRYRSSVVAEVILPHFRVRPFCVVVLSSLWNPEVPGSNLGTNLVLSTSLVTRMSRKNPCSNLCGMCGYKFHHRLWCLLWYKCRPV